MLRPDQLRQARGEMSRAGHPDQPCPAKRDTAMSQHNGDSLSATGNVAGGKAGLLACRDRQPPTLAVEPDGIPAELKALDQWVLWAWEWQSNRKHPAQSKWGK